MDWGALISGNQVFTGAAGAGILLGVLNYLRPLPAKLWNFIIDRNTTLIAVHSGDTATFEAVSEWMGNHNLARWAKRFRLRETYDDETRDYTTRCDPHYGTYWFWWKGRLCRATTWKDESPGGSVNAKTRDFGEIRVFGRKSDINQEFLGEIDQIRKDLEAKGVCVKGLPSEYYESSTRLHAAAAPALKKHQLETVEQDIDRFLKGEQWYLDRGIPYRRGYLFYGPPGTGKTSLIKHLAVKFKASIYYATASDLMGGTFGKSITVIPQGSFVVIEDIDRIFAQAKLSNSADKDDKKSLIDLAAFLNSTDGISSPHGLIFILTANDLAPIDPAVLRSGRIDQRVLLDAVDEYQANLMHIRFFASENAEFARLAAERKYTPAQVQEYLLRARRPENVMNTLEAA